MDSDRRDEWRLWIEKTVRTHELLYERLDNRVHNAETISNEARAEFRAVRGEILVKLNALHVAIEGDYAGHPGLRQDIADLKSADGRKERRASYHWAFWTALIPAVAVQFLILIGLLIVNWDNIQGFITLHEHIHQAAAIERDTKKHKAQRARRKHKAVEAPEVPSDAGEPDPSE